MSQGSRRSCEEAKKEGERGFSTQRAEGIDDLSEKRPIDAILVSAAEIGEVSLAVGAAGRGGPRSPRRYTILIHLTNSLSDEIFRAFTVRSAQAAAAHAGLRAACIKARRATA